jgi:hypothetical protein
VSKFMITDLRLNMHCAGVVLQNYTLKAHLAETCKVWHFLNPYCLATVGVD